MSYDDSHLVVGFILIGILEDRHALDRALFFFLFVLIRLLPQPLPTHLLLPHPLSRSPPTPSPTRSSTAGRSSRPATCSRGEETRCSDVLFWDVTTNEERLELGAP
ncbi:putative proline-rich receptor-like protein kinase PERK3 [Iris pallida]|uniref:Proline-rich receptor-like protein kinase PERK3 n=1 Tax=Iris pallida TaxID=29817 RepID=A0AAX6GTL2_IRIPA|nr:putative proline-rich receptor-like protein kinase PERK3 [Iris pallida]